MHSGPVIWERGRDRRWSGLGSRNGLVGINGRVKTALQVCSDGRLNQKTVYFEALRCGRGF